MFIFAFESEVAMFSSYSKLKIWLYNSFSNT